MYQRILVPIDGSATSERGLAEALALARLTHGKLRLIHVLDVSHFASGFTTEAMFVARTVGWLRERAGQLLADCRARTAAAGVEADTALLEAKDVRIAEHIADEALAWNADLIVLGTHGRRGLERCLLGSDAEQVLRLSPVPVLLVRETGEASPCTPASARAA